jgi:hypothetical protein
MLSNVPAGSYYLLIDVDRDPAQRDLGYEVRIRRDTPRSWPFLVGMLLLAVPAVFAFARKQNFDYTRWQESDYAASEEDEDE